MECYIKAYILELQKKLRVYLLDEEGYRSSISIQLLDALNPYLHIPEDQDGSFVTLTLAFGPDKYQFQFDVILLKGNVIPILIPKRIGILTPLLSTE